MLPLTKEKALELFEHDLPLYVLHEDGSETTVEDRMQITEHEGIFGIEKKDWENEAAKETRLLYGSTDKYGIYQLKDDPELRQFRFEGTEALKRMGKHWKQTKRKWSLPTKKNNSLKQTIYRVNRKAVPVWESFVPMLCQDKKAENT